MMKKRILRIFFLPVAVFMWVVGWSLMWIGDQPRKEERREEQSVSVEDVFQVQVVKRKP